MKFCVKVDTDIKTGKTEYRFGGKNEATLWSRLCGYKRICKIRCGIGYIHGKEIISASVGKFPPRLFHMQSEDYMDAD
mgnify:CR=1 FL=1